MKSGEWKVPESIKFTSEELKNCSRILSKLDPSFDYHELDDWSRFVRNVEDGYDGVREEYDCAASERDEYERLLGSLPDAICYNQA